MENKYTVTVMPWGKKFTAYEGDSLYTLLRVNELIEADDIMSQRLRLDKGVISDADDPAAEEAVFTQSQLDEDCMLAGERHIMGDAVITVLSAEHDIPAEKIEEEAAHRGFGLVVDIGTANICGGLVHLDNLFIPMLTNMPNSQLSMGKDVNERLALCREDKEKQELLRHLLRQDVDRIAQKLCRRTGIRGKDINSVALVGNYPTAAMYLGQLPPAGWPPLMQIIEENAASVGIEHLRRDTPVYILPAAGPQFGADTTAAVLAANMQAKKDSSDVSILIDMGMRGELVAAGRGRLLATSVPALPFEGAGLSSGMSALTGAITGVRLGDDVRLRTIRDARPRGICGAGMISVVCAMLRAGMLDSEGRMLMPDDLPERLAERFRGTMSGREFVLSYGDKSFAADICVNQDDIHQVQLAKGAIYAACKAMLAAMDADDSDLKEIFLAEASTSNIRAAEALAIGLLPDLDERQVISIGNAAWQGGYLALSGKPYMEAVLNISKEMEMLDLTSDLVYAEHFLTAMNFDLERAAEE